MKKRNIILWGIGLTFIILPYLFNLFSYWRLASLFLGIFILVFDLIKNKKNILIIILTFLISVVATYGLDTLMYFKFNRVPIFSYEIKSNDKLRTYNSFFYRIYDCNNKLVLDYGYKKNYVCDPELLSAIDINDFLNSPFDTFEEYDNKFVRVHGKISTLSGAKKIVLSSYTMAENSLNGYVNFNLNYNLEVQTNEDISKFRVYDYIDIIGRVDKTLKEKDKITIYLKDVFLVPSDIYDNYSYEIIKNNNFDSLSILVEDKDYYYLGINALNIKYDSNNIYELAYLLSDNRLTFDDLIDNTPSTILKNEDEVVVGKKYELNEFNLIDCNNGKKIVANKKYTINYQTCDLNVSNDK